MKQLDELELLRHENELLRNRIKQLELKFEQQTVMIWAPPLITPKRAFW